MFIILFQLKVTGQDLHDEPDRVTLELPVGLETHGENPQGVPADGFHWDRWGCPTVTTDISCSRTSLPSLQSADTEGDVDISTRPLQCFFCVLSVSSSEQPFLRLLSATTGVYCLANVLA